MESSLRSRGEPPSSSSLPFPPSSLPSSSDTCNYSQYHNNHRSNHHSRLYSYNKREVIRKGPLWISAGILVLVPLFILNVQLWLYQDPAIHADQLVESHHWRPPSRILGESDSAKCILWESTGQLVWVQRDTVQVLVVDAQQQWWFLPAETASATTPSQQHNQTTMTTRQPPVQLKLVHGHVQWAPTSPPQSTLPEQPPDPYQFRTNTAQAGAGGGDGGDVSPWHAAQRIVQEHWGIPSRLLRVTDYDGYQQGKVPPLAQDHWNFLGRMPLMNYYPYHSEQQQRQHPTVDSGEFSGYLYTYLWKVQSPPTSSSRSSSRDPPNAISLSVAEVQQAIAQQRFNGMRSLASLALALAFTSFPFS